MIDALADGLHRRADLAKAAEVTPRRLTALLTLLSDVAAVRIDRRGAVMRGGASRDEAVGQALERAEARERIDRSRIEMLRGYAETRRCRRDVLLGYFGQQLDEPCGNCDTCADGAAYEEDAGSSATGTRGEGYVVDGRVRHAEWGEGTVMSLEDDRLTVFFEAEGYKTLSLAVVEDNDLLEQAG